METLPKDKAINIYTTLISIWCDQYDQELISVNIGEKDEKNDINPISNVASF